MEPSLAQGLNPVTRAFLETLARQNSTPIQDLSLTEARGALAAAQAGDVPRPAAKVEDCTIPGGPRGELSIHIVRSPGGELTRPAVIYFHGGGWVLGDQRTHDRLIRELAVASGAAVVFLEYSRSPEAKFPVALEEAYATTAWIAKNGAALGLDGGRLALAGDSAGGNLVAATALLAKERGGPKIDLQLMFYPVKNAAFDSESYRQFAHGYFLTRDAMKWFWDQYLPDSSQRDDPLASPLRATPDQLRGLPPAFIATAEFDVLRDEGEAYGSKLADAGVEVTSVRYLGTIHDFVMLDSLSETPAPRAAIEQGATILRRVLGVDKHAHV